MPIGSFKNPLIYAIATLMITPHGTAQSSAGSKAVKPRDASSGQASGRDAATGMSTGRREASSGQASGREAASGQASGRKSGSVVAADFNYRDAQSGQASGRQDQFPKASGAVADEPQVQSNARNSAHATEALDSTTAGNNKAGNVQSNPMYKDNGKSGQNPLYESKDKSAYKDGEDPVTHTRPNNNKTNK
jgi:hypothetical protein